MSTNTWTRAEKIAAASFFVTLLALIAGLIVVPEVREFFNLKNQNSNSASESNKNRDPSKVQIPSEPETISIALTKEGANQLENIGTTAAFTEGEGIRFNVSVVEKGYLYILQKGSSGERRFLFPDSQYNKGKNDVEANKVAIVPDEGWLFFDGKRGPETIYFIYAKVKDRLIEKENETSQSLSQRAQEITDFLDKMRSGSRSDSFAIPNGNLVRIITLRHK